MAIANYCTQVVILYWLSFFQIIYGDVCGSVNLNEHSVVIVGEIQNETKSSNTISVRILENIYGNISHHKLELSQVNKIKSCGHALNIGDQRIFVIDAHPDRKKFSLSGTLPLGLKHLTLNAKYEKLENREWLESYFAADVETKCNENFQCQSGGYCIVLSTGKPICRCPIVCTKEYDPVCGSDGITYPNPCVVKYESCLKQRNITIIHYGHCGVSTCRDVLTEELGRDDGHYFLQLNRKCQIPVRVYCHGMNTTEPKEYLSLPQGERNNYAIVYDKRLPTNPVNTRYRCDGLVGRLDYSRAGVTRFNKVRLDVEKMTIITDDFTFAHVESGRSIKFGEAGDCFSANPGPCRKGSFKIDLTNTGLHVDRTVRWSANGFPLNIRMQDFYRSTSNHVVSAKCGGWCGHCGPDGDVTVQQDECIRQDDPCISIQCPYYSICYRHPNSELGYKCACPNRCSSRIAQVCGSNGRTYDNECLMQQAACSMKTMIALVKLGSCVSEEAVDVIYLTDFTSEQRQTMLIQTHSFYKNLLNFFDFESSKSQLGYIMHSATGNSSVEFFEYGYNLTVLRSFIPYIPNNPYRKPLEMILTEVYSNFSAMLQIGYPRSTIPKVLVIASDGYSVVDRLEFERAAKSLKDLGVMIVMFGVGTRNYYNILKPAASDEAYSFWARYEVQMPLMSANVANGITSGLQSCLWKRCHYHSYCIQHRIGRAECVCPEASDYTDPVCGSNGRTYKNYETLIQDSCQRRTFITLRQQGACTVGVCKSMICSHYSFCQVNSLNAAQCVCPTSCSTRMDLVCGSNSQVYENECELRKWSCNNKIDVTVAHTGPCKSIPIDVVFAIDGSSKDHPTSFLQMKNFISRIVSFLPVSKSEINVGVVEYSDRQYAEINLDDFYDSKAIIKDIQLIKASEGSSAKTGNVIKFVREQMFAPGLRNRLNVSKVLVLVTDGKEYSNDYLLSEAELMKQTGARILAVKVGSKPDTLSLGKAISPTENLYSVNEVNSLRRLASPVARDILKIPKSTSDSLFDVAFILDGSQISRSEFSEIKDVAKSLVSKLNVGEDKTHIGVIEFGQDARIALPFSWVNNENQVKLFMDTIQPTGGTSRLDRAFTKTKDIFNIEQGYRPGASKIAVLIVNSEYNGLDVTLEKAMQDLRKDGIRVYIIASNRPTKERLETLVHKDDITILTRLSFVQNNVDQFVKRIRDEDEANIPVYDIGFALGASGFRQSDLFLLQKEFAKQIIAFQSNAKRRYGLIVYGPATVKTNFQLYKNEKSFMKIMSDVPLPTSSDANLTSVLRQAMKLYQFSPAKSHKVLVLFINILLLPTEVSALAGAARDLYRQDIRLILINTNNNADHSKWVPDPSLIVDIDPRNTNQRANIYKAGGFLFKAPCYAFPCRYSANCIPHADNTVTCQCPTTCPDLHDVGPVCGSDDVTYDNHCDLRRNLCLKQTDIMIKNLGQCVVHSPVDIGFLLDGSGSVGKDGFRHVLNFVNLVVTAFRLSHNATQIGVTEFSNRPVIQIQLNEYQNLSLLQDEISKITDSGGRTRTDVALRSMSREFFTYDKGSRPGVPKVVVLVTDGRSTGSEPLSDAVKGLRQMGAIIYSVGIGDEISEQELHDISRTRKDIFLSKKFDSLGLLAPELVEKIMKDLRDLPLSDMEVMFAIGAYGLNAANIFNQEKTIVSSIVDSQGLSRVRYGLIQYGLDFAEVSRSISQFRSNKAFKEFVEATVLKSRGKSISLAMDVAKNEFSSSNVKRKVLVVFMNDLTAKEIENLKTSQPNFVLIVLKWLQLFTAAVA